MECCHEGCKAAATHYPKIQIPATGHAIDTHQPIQMLMGIALCEAHCRALDVAEFLDTPQGNGMTLRECINEITACMGKERPDYGRAFVSAVVIGSLESKRMLGK